MEDKIIAKYGIFTKEPEGQSYQYEGLAWVEVKGKRSPLDWVSFKTVVTKEALQISGSERVEQEIMRKIT